MKNSIRTPKRNAWPCEQCGHAIDVPANAGRLPKKVALCLLLLLLLVLTTFQRFAAGVAGSALYAGLLLLGIAELEFFRVGRNVWRCVRCSHSTGARQRPVLPISVAVAVPTYNNQASIYAVVRRVFLALPNVALFVVDDGSTDTTATDAQRAASDMGRSLTLLRHPKNTGKGAAIRTALREGLRRGFSHLITLDGDGQHFPEDLNSFKEAIARYPNAVMIGSRDLSGEHVQGVSRFGRAFSNFWLYVQTGLRITDSQSGFRAYPIAPILALGCHARRYDFEVEVLTLAGRSGIPLRETPIQVYYPPAAVRVSHFNKLWDNVRISWVNTRLLCTLPLRLLGWPRKPSLVDPPSNIERSWSAQSRGGAFGHFFFLLVLKFFGNKLAELILIPVSIYFVFAARTQVRHGQNFLNKVLGPPRSKFERARRAFQHVHSFSQCILDRGLVTVKGAKAIQWHSEGEHYMLEHRKAQRGALFVSAHVGNYEVAGSAFGTHRIPFQVVMLDAEAEHIKKVYQLLGKSEQLFQTIAINQGEFPALRVLQALRAGDAIAMHGDRILDGHWTWGTFFGQPAAVSTGIFLIAAAAKVPIILTFAFKEDDGTYRFIAEAPHSVELRREQRSHDLDQHAQWYLSRVEHYARKYPFQWFNFYDFWAHPVMDKEN